MGDILITYVVSLIMHLLLEAPISKIDRTYFTSSKCNTFNFNECFLLIIAFPDTANFC